MEHNNEELIDLVKRVFIAEEVGAKSRRISSDELRKLKSIYSRKKG